MWSEYQYCLFSGGSSWFSYPPKATNLGNLEIYLREVVGWFAFIKNQPGNDGWKPR